MTRERQVHHSHLQLRMIGSIPNGLLPWQERQFLAGSLAGPIHSRSSTKPAELLLGATTYDVAVKLWSTGSILAKLYLGKPIMPEGQRKEVPLLITFAIIHTWSLEKNKWENFKREMPSVFQLAREEEFSKTL